MKETYTTLLHRGESEYEEKRSRFLGHASPCRSEEEALAFLEEMRKKYSDARHNVFAYLLAEGNLMRYSDDAEPQGTAGMPVLDLLRKSGVTDAAVVVTRYFGGTLLGTGGLVRAYQAAAREAVKNAEIVTYREASLLSLRCDYGEYGRITALLPSFTCRLEQTAFTDAVEMQILLLKSQAAPFFEKIRESTAGRVTPVLLEDRYTLFS